MILLNEMNSDKEKWQKQKSLGKKKYILINGALLWISGSIVYSILTIFFNPNPRDYNITGIFARFISYAIIFGLCGIVTASRLWNAKIKDLIIIKVQCRVTLYCVLFYSIQE